MKLQLVSGYVFEGDFSIINDKSAILCPEKTEVADFVSFKGSIVQELNYCDGCNT